MNHHPFSPVVAFGLSLVLVATAVPTGNLWAADDTSEYEGYADVIYRVGDRFYWASGSHCSCYGLEDQWSPEEYSRDELVAALLRGRHFWWAADSVAVRDEVLERVSPESHSQPGHA